ncbi:MULTISPECIES: hypothetical protein [unclassified Marinobacter]|jgi:hypothetical protein|uniref:hypothetical protein n=1 Tax=unclassified Marinobacter TaxID=83889 RepID=UPI000C8D360D|nr:MULTISPECIES: hypothetical protein [unclassified Marinobacter]MAB51577.1 hypothetical protein [Marinobacter sp.]|tara:strand:+ start:1677 stop:2270 length:594 start_codon:yes stop_codon:yes gene_type:complete
MEVILMQFFSALVGALVVYIFGVRKSSIDVRNAFFQKQLSEFYSPIAGYRKRIQSKSEIREKVSSVAQEAWKEAVAKRNPAWETKDEREKEFEPYGKIIEYDNAQLREELIPLYREILRIFTEKYWLADEDTREYYESFSEFIEIWERYLSEALPSNVLIKLHHSEEELHGFYEHVERKLSHLQHAIVSPSFWKVWL